MILGLVSQRVLNCIQPLEDQTANICFFHFNLGSSINNKPEVGGMIYGFKVSTRAGLPVASSAGMLVVLMCCRGEEAAFVLHLTGCSLQPPIPFKSLFCVFKCEQRGRACVFRLESFRLGISLHVPS